MATRVEKILSDARLTLADPNQERWDDATLIAILNEGLIDFCQQTQMLHERINVPIIIGNPYFSLPDDCWTLTRVLYDDRPLPLVTHRELDEMTMSRRYVDFGLPQGGPRWEVVKGEPKAIVYDRRNMLQGKVYPIPDRPLEDVAYTFVGTPSETFFNIDLYGITTGATFGTVVDTYGVASALGDLTQDTELNPEFGVASALTIADEVAIPQDGFGIIVDITDYDFNTDYGTVVNLLDSNVATETFEDTYGFVDGIVEACSFLTCYYLKNPVQVVDIDSLIDIPVMYDIALKFYVCGQAFMNDIDTGYQQKGAAQMMIYERHVKSAKKDSSRDWTRAGQFETTYRRGF